MARASPVEDDALTENLNCPICLDLLTEPVTLYLCFHSFCKQCLQQSIQGARETYRSPYSCPQCRRRFYPSDAEKVNHHLQNIVNSHRKAMARIADVRQYEMQEMTSESHHVEIANDSSQRPSKKELDSLTSFLSAVDGRLQSLLTALDKTSIKTTGTQNEAFVETETTLAGEQPSRDVNVQSEQPAVVVATLDQGVGPHSTTVHETHSDCEFEAETLTEFIEKSKFIFRRHFLLIMFVMHLCILIFCFVQAFL